MSDHSAVEEGVQYTEQTKNEYVCFILTSIQIDSMSEVSRSFLLT